MGQGAGCRAGNRLSSYHTNVENLENIVKVYSLLNVYMFMFIGTLGNFLFYGPHNVN